MINITTNKFLKQTINILLLTILLQIIIIIILIIFSSNNGGYGIFKLIQPVYCEGLVEINLKKEDLPFITEASLEKEWVSKLKLTQEEILRPIRNWMSLDNYKILNLEKNQLTKLTEWWPSKGIKLHVELKTEIEQNTGIQETLNLLEELNKKRGIKILTESINPVAESIRNFGETPRSSRAFSWLTCDTLDFQTHFYQKQFTAQSLNVNTEMINNNSNIDLPQTAKTCNFTINTMEVQSTLSTSDSRRCSRLLNNFILENITSNTSSNGVRINSEYSNYTEPFEQTVEPLRLNYKNKELPPLPNQNSTFDQAETSSQYSRDTLSLKNQTINWRGTIGGSSFSSNESLKS